MLRVSSLQRAALFRRQKPAGRSFEELLSIYSGEGVPKALQRPLIRKLHRPLSLSVINHDLEVHSTRAGLLFPIESLEKFPDDVHHEREYHSLDDERGQPKVCGMKGYEVLFPCLLSNYEPCLRIRLH